jgi:methyltransferase family protein
VRFFEGNIYSLSKNFKKGEFDVAVMRGVLHHVYNPFKALKEVSSVVDVIIILEPNGFNPILKIIEKTSSYHLLHEERSYWPPTLSNWINSAGYNVISQKYYGIVPYFCPSWFAKILHTLEPFFESIPMLNKLYSGIVVIVAKK